uniref:Uncharacterized protein n=1 Tax=Amphimedon queenslandica TaxID=400682 RepID=A0A1X7TRI6_AMPQE
MFSLFGASSVQSLISILSVVVDPILLRNHGRRGGEQHLASLDGQFFPSQSGSATPNVFCGPLGKPDSQ